MDKRYLNKKILLPLILIGISALVLIPIYWVVKTSVTGENLYKYPPSLIPQSPHIFYFVDVWFSIPFPIYLLNSVIVSAIVVFANLIIDSLAAYGLTKEFPGKRIVILLYLSCMMIPFQTSLIPAFLITKKLHLLNTHIGLSLPIMSTIICIFVLKSNFDAVPRSLVDSAKIDGVSELGIISHIMLPLSKPAIATTVILTFMWSWNSFLWPLIIIKKQEMQTLPLGLASFVSYFEDVTGPLYAFCVMVVAPIILVFLLAQREFIKGMIAGATKG